MIADWSMDSYVGYGTGNEPWNRGMDEEEERIDSLKFQASKEVKSRQVIEERNHRAYDLIQVGMYRTDLEKLFFYVADKVGMDIKDISEIDLADTLSNLLDEVEEWYSMEAYQ